MKDFSIVSEAFREDLPTKIQTKVFLMARLATVMAFKVKGSG